MATITKNALVVIVVCTLMTCFSVGSAAQGNRYTKVLIESLNLGPASSLNLNAHGRSGADIDKRLIEIYQSNGLQPFWINDGKPSQSGIDIFTVLKNSDKHGLNPSNYLISNINQFWNGKSSADLVKLDIVLTLGMILYVADQREGRLQPRLIDPKLFATASDVVVDWQNLLKTAFKAPNMANFLADQAPPSLQYKYLQQKLADYRMIAARGGWPSVPAGDVLKPDMVDQRVILLRKRLSVTGEDKSKESDKEVYSPQLVAAVKKFQKRHSLTPDGILGKQTIAAMNVPVEFRIQQIIINMERYRWLNRGNDGPFIAVNIAAFEAIAGRPGTYDIVMPVIVGKTYHKTPVFNDTITSVVFNPYWNVPPSIARDEMLPKLQKDSAYLSTQHMRIFQGWGVGAAELDAASIDWSNVTKKAMDQYHIRQDPGPHNSLGTLKLLFPNKYNVYLHDTPAHGLFKMETRAFSHGCIRMSRPAEMAAWALGGEKKGWSVERVNEIIATRERQVVTLDKPMAVLILYRTAFIDPDDNALYFYNDIYGRDKLLTQALLNSKG